MSPPERAVGGSGSAERGPLGFGDNGARCMQHTIAGPNCRRSRLLGPLLGLRNCS